MYDERGLLRAVSWRDLCPWLIIFRVFRQAVSLPALTLATAAVLLTPIGWRIPEKIFLEEDEQAGVLLDGYALEVGEPDRWPAERDATPAAADFRHPSRARAVLFDAAGEIASVFHGLMDPFRQLFDPRWTLTEFAYFLFGGLWTLAVWALAGGAITRLAIVPLATEQHIGFRAALWHSLRMFPTYFLSPLFPFLGVIVLGALLALVGLLLRGGSVGLAVAGVLWFLVILGGFAMAYLLVGLLFGWPLMWAAASAERDADLFDSVSRAYSYTRQAPLKYLFYAIVAVLFGGLCWLLVELFAEAVISLGEWGVSWGAGRDRMLELRDATIERSSLARFGLSLIAAWTGLVRAVATGFAFSFFWCAFCAIYLLLRYDVDRREMDEVWLDPREPAASPPVASPTAARPE
jgi:hypothetical protein